MIVAQITEQILKNGEAAGLSVYETYMITSIIALVGAIITMALYIKGLHKQHSREQSEHAREQSENIEKMTVAMTNSTHAIENNTRIIDRLFNVIVKD